MQQTLSPDGPVGTALPNDVTRRSEADAQALMAIMAKLLTGSACGPDARSLSDITLIAGDHLEDSELLRLGDLARTDGRHVLHISMKPDKWVPAVTLVILEGGSVTIHERCWLTIPRPGARLVIVPEGFGHGGYTLSGRHRLKRCRAASSFDAALPAMIPVIRMFHELRSGVPAGRNEPEDAAAS